MPDYRFCYNFHTHTHRCHHATGDERDYIKRAIQNGIADMGFSDHAPFMFPDGHQSPYRVYIEDATDYITTLRALQKEYKDDITLHIGFEMEYYPLYFNDMLSLVQQLGAEYLILGQHFIDSEFPGWRYSGEKTDDENRLTTYVDEVIAGMNTGVFSYLAHPDIFYFIGEDAMYEREMRRLCRASIETATPLEINLLGIRDHRHYPCDRFFRIAGEEGCSAVVGFDAHDPQAAYDGASLTEAVRLMDTYRLSFVENPILKPIRPKGNIAIR